MKQFRTTKTMYFVARDHLGSVMALYTETRTKVEESSYDAWGRRRNPTNWTYTSVPTPTITRHGFTNHEHLDKYSLINMNGRVYDPVLGRFLSPDPYIQDPSNTQNFDRFSYVLNNPLKYTDPSGYKFWPKLKRWWFFHVDRYMKRASTSNNADASWDDPFTSNDTWQFGTSGTLGGGAPTCGSASGPGSGGSGTHGGFSPDGGDDTPENPEENCHPCLINNSKNIIWYKPDEGNDWDAIPLGPGQHTSIPVDGINVGGTVYKVTNGYEFVLVGEDNEVDYFYMLNIPFIDEVYEVTPEWLHNKIYKPDGTKQYYEYPEGSDKWYWDTQWWNIFFPNFQIPDPRH